jgi:choice-of-anchor A domain-containing protein
VGDGPRSRARFVLIAACVTVSSLSFLGAPATPAAASSGCASLGAAADFGVFSNGAFNSSGTSINGRIAAAGDVALDAISVNPAAGDATPTIVAGGNFTGGQTGAGGTVNGGVEYGGTSNVAQNFTVNGGLVQAQPPFSFATQFVSLKNLSTSLGDLPQSGGASVSLNPYSRALELTGAAPGLNVFSVDAADLAQAQGIVINLTQPGASAVIDVTTNTVLSIAPQYMSLQGTASATGILWNMPLATALTVNTEVGWQGSILAPNASVTTAGHPQLYGQLIAGTVPSSGWVVYGPKFTGCAPPPPSDDTLTLDALCIDTNGNLDMRLRNTGTASRTVSWKDLKVGGDFGDFVVPSQHDQFFVVRGGDGASVIVATSGTTTVRANGTNDRCEGQITVQLNTEGTAPPGQTWPVRVTDGQHGHVSQVLTLAAGQIDTLTVPGGYVPGTVPIGGVVGGVLYTISVDDPHGAAVTTISLNPVEILDDQNELVVVTLVYESEGGAGIGPPVPVDPTLPPEAPDPPPGPGLVPGTTGADLAISQQVSPARVPAGGTVHTVTVVRNLGNAPAVGVVAREIPHFRAAMANAVAHVLSLTTTAGTCNQRRPVHCSLGTLAPGATVTIRTRDRILVAATLTSTVTVSSTTPDTNTTNNTASAVFVATTKPVTINAGISAPPTGRVGAALTYQVSARVSARAGGRAGDPSVRVCTQPPSGLIQVSSPGTFRFRGVYCRDYAQVAVGHSASFSVHGFPSQSGRLVAAALAAAVGVAHLSRASALIDVAGPAACPAASRFPRGGSGSGPPAHAAC